MRNHFTQRSLILITLLLLTSICAEARKFIINAGATTPLPVRIEAYGNTYYITERNRYSNDPNSGACVVFDVYDEVIFYAYASDDTPLDTQQYTRTNKTDSYGNIEYTRITLGGTGVTWKNSENFGNGMSDVAGDVITNSGSNYSNSGQGASDYQQHIAEGVRGTVEDVGGRFANNATRLMAYEAEGYPNVMVKLGWSNLWGEYARLKACIGDAGGFVLYGGIGKDMFAKKEEFSWGDKSYKTRMTWHAGIGYYICVDDDLGSSDISLGVSAGNSCRFDPLVIMGDLSFSYFFGNRKIFGVYGGAGIGGALDLDGEDLKWAWNLELGVAIKLWQE